MLQLVDVTKTYVTGQLKQTALKGINLAFRDSEFVSILGHSGSGKTTMLNIIGGLDQYTSGDLLINGVSTKKYSDKDWDSYRNNDIGFVFQSYNLITHQSVLANVELALTLSGVSKKQRKERAIAALEKVGLKDHIYKKPNQLSGGQMQRVAIARALVNNPSIILADEPTGALDSQTSVAIMDLLKQISEDKLVIMVTHNPSLAQEYSSRIIKLADGEITDDSNPYIIEQAVEVVEKKKKYTSMSFLTALSLSLNNFMTKKVRTFMTSFAGSIGIMGIALILSVSTGFQQYIDYIEKSTMTSYPLTIYSDTANGANAMLALMQQQNKHDESGNSVVEKQYISSLFSSVGKNDLKSFKQYIDANQDTVSQYCSSIVYKYSISPTIYATDITGSIVKLNPSSMSSLMEDNPMMSMMASSTGIYNEMIDDYDQIEENYDILAGRLPESYNEMIIVLNEPDSISDLLAYSLGLKDTSQLKKLMMMASNNETIEAEECTYTYQQLLDLQFKLIIPSDLYRYNSEYDVYEDISSDKQLLKQVYDNSEDLYIVGILCLKEDSEANILSSGVNYSKELTLHVIDKSKNSDIVLKQMANEKIDVFTNKPFTEDKINEINFDNMISIDTNMLNSAFSVNPYAINIDPEKLQLLLEKYSNLLSQNVETDTSKPLNQLKQLCYDLCYEEYVEYCNSVVNDKGNVEFSNESAGLFVEQFINSDYYLNQIADIAQQYQAETQLLTAFYDDFLANYLLSAVELLDVGENTSIDQALSYADSSVSFYLANALDEEKMQQLNALAAYLTATKAGSVIITNGESLTGQFVSDITGMFGNDIIAVDANKLASAFKFNMTQQDLAVLMETMMSSSETKTYQSNLLTLGYQDVDDPSYISFYFDGFDSKQQLKDFISAYNEAQTDESKIISYTDTTGLLMSSVETIINAVTYVLIAFVSISLVVSSIMIGVITLISVLERTKEIGILRAIGASKKDVGNVFNAETFIVGLLSGIIGIVGSEILLIPINKILYHLTSISTLKAVLPLNSSLILILISVVLTLLSGLIPARSASRKNPVEALRSE
ncbi:MAG: ATP-binding cassette domain-containing protein [Erysipelotrichaceae bacterium]